MRDSETRFPETIAADRNFRSWRDLLECVFVVALIARLGFDPVLTLPTGHGSCTPPCVEVKRLSTGSFFLNAGHDIWVGLEWASL